MANARPLTRATQLGLLQPGTVNLAVTPQGQPFRAHNLGQSLPTGTVTFLFTDIQGSTPLWENHPQHMAAAIAVHNAVLRQAIEANGGMVFKVVGDAFQAAIRHLPIRHSRQPSKVNVLCRRQPGTSWGRSRYAWECTPVSAGLDPGGDEYAVSHCKNRVARIMSSAHGEQVLLSQKSAILVRRELPDHVSLKDLGEYHLKGMLHPEHLYQANCRWPAVRVSSSSFRVHAPATTFRSNSPLSSDVRPRSSRCRRC